MVENKLLMKRSTQKIHNKILKLAKFLYRIQAPLKIPNIFQIMTNYFCFFIDLKRYKSREGSEKIELANLMPCIFDKTPVTQINFHYFYQDTWAARKIFENKPRYHVDIGSTALFVGILSQFTKVCSVDIRPLPVKIEGLELKSGSLLNLPFSDGELESVSSLCVIEHIGLGRYGDELDPKGTDKAISELIRVLGIGGNLYISVPIDEKTRVYYNAHRSFSYDDFITKVKDLWLIEVKFIHGKRIYSIEEIRSIDLTKEWAVGLFHFRKNK